MGLVIPDRHCLRTRSDGKFVAPLPLIRGLWQQVTCVASPEQDGLQLGPDLAISPMLTKDIRWIDLPWDVVHPNHSRCHRLAGVVVGQPMPSLV